MRLTTMLLLAAMAGASCTSNAKNDQVTNTQTVGDITIESSSEGGSSTYTQENCLPLQEDGGTVSQDSICDNPDLRPQYDAKDQMMFLLDFLNKNLHYPEEAVEKQLSGTVNVQMVVEKDGTPTNFKFIRQVDPILDNEAMRVAKLLPKFKPAKKDGKPVRCHFIFSVPFRCK